MSTIYDAADGEFHADYLVTYDSAWGVTRIIFNYDDGTHTVGSYDLADEYNYTDYLATFDSPVESHKERYLSTMTAQSRSVYYDVADEFDWSLIQFEYDSNWNLTGTHGQNDDGSSFGNGFVGDGGGGTNAGATAPSRGT